MKQINFCHEYFKLKNKRFTTIRGVSNLQLYNVGEIVEICVNRSVLFIAKVIKLEISQISKISLAAMMELCEYNQITRAVLEKMKDLKVSTG